MKFENFVQNLDSRTYSEAFVRQQSGRNVSLATQLLKFLHSLAVCRNIRLDGEKRHWGQKHLSTLG